MNGEAYLKSVGRKGKRLGLGVRIKKKAGVIKVKRSKCSSVYIKVKEGNVDVGFNESDDRYKFLSGPCGLPVKYPW